jgi:hypothetical protein
LDRLKSPYYEFVYIFQEFEGIAEAKKLKENLKNHEPKQLQFEEFLYRRLGLDHFLVKSIKLDSIWYI